MNVKTTAVSGSIFCFRLSPADSTRIYFWYVYVEDLNTIFYGDGEDSSPNYIIVLLLSWVVEFTAFTGVTNRRTDVPRIPRPLRCDD